MFDNTVTSRFWPKVDKNGPVMPHMQTPCWVWTGSKKDNGYGQLILRDRSVVLAHRLAYMFEYGDIEDGLLVCHKCDNPSCVRLDHLFLGTPKDNMQDSVQKGRKHKFTPEQIKERRAAGRKAYADQNHDQVLAAQKKYREQNKEREKERKRVWYEQNRDRVQSQQREYRETREIVPAQRTQHSVVKLQIPQNLYSEIQRIGDEGTPIGDTIVRLVQEGLKALRCGP